MHALPPDALETIIDDPDDDSVGSIEITQVRAGSDESDMSMSIDFSDSSTMDQIGGYVMFDVDQKKKTGYPPRYLCGTPVAGHRLRVLRRPASPRTIPTRS